MGRGDFGLSFKQTIIMKRLLIFTVLFYCGNTVYPQVPVGVREKRIKSVPTDSEAAVKDKNKVDPATVDLKDHTLDEIKILGVSGTRIILKGVGEIKRTSTYPEWYQLIEITLNTEFAGTQYFNNGGKPPHIILRFMENYKGVATIFGGDLLIPYPLELYEEVNQKLIQSFEKSKPVSVSIRKEADNYEASFNFSL